MEFTNLVYNLLPNLFWSITPALPTGAPGTRLPVGSPEMIPDVTFITRALVPADGFTAAERTRLNGYITQATTYHTLFGLAPISIGSIEDILNHFSGAAGLIGRVRIVSHGNDAFMFVPLFNNGSWGFGIQQDRLEAFQSSDEEGLRFLICGNKTRSPTLVDSVADIVTGIRAFNSAVLVPFGLDVAGSPAAGNMKQFFDVINDHYQIQNGVILAQTNNPPAPPALALLTAAQQAILRASLTLIENAIRTRLVGTVVNSAALTAAHLDALKTAVMGATPTQLLFYGPMQNLGPTVIADLTAAMATAPRVEADLRNAIVGSLAEPMFPNNTGKILNGLNTFNQLALTLGGAVVNGAAISANPDLLSFFLVCNDLFFFDHGEVRIGGAAITAAQKTSLRNGLRAIATIISARVVAGGAGITAAELTRLRTGVEALTTRQTLTGGWQSLDTKSFPDLQAANTALTVTGTNIGFRAKLDHLRSIMRAMSNVDVRGCLVGATPAFLDTLRNFLGAGVNRPTLSAPNWFQSFPAAVQYGGYGSPVFTDIDNVVNAGIAPHISAADVASSLATWQGLIDFAPHHHAFISGLFNAPATQFDFATLEWRVWRTGAMATGIPILRMQAERIDDIVGLSLGDVIERFRIIFEVDAANAPAAAARGRLTQLQPHIVTFKTIRTNVAAATGPADPGLPGFFAALNALAGQITGIAGFPAPAAPLPPASASLADIQTSVANIQAHIDSLLSTNLDPFFAAVQARLAHANAEIRYYYNIGLPLLLQSSAQPTAYRVTTFMSANTSAERTSRVAAALRSWMRIQWSGNTVQAPAMNATIQAVAITTNAQRLAASQASMLSADDPGVNPAADAGINPMQKFRDHIVTRP